jgi:hypothetical protein
MGRENSIITGASIPRRSMSSHSIPRANPRKNDDKRFVRVIAVNAETRMIWYEQIINNFSNSNAPKDFNATSSSFSEEELNKRFPKALPEDASQTRLPIINELVELKSVPDFSSGVRNGQYNRRTVYATGPITAQSTVNDNRVPQQESYNTKDASDITQNLDTGNYLTNDIGIIL